MDKMKDIEGYEGRYAITEDGQVWSYYSKSFIYQRTNNKGYKIVLLGAMQDAIRCPRAILVGRALIKHGFDVKYIMHEGNLKTQDELEEQLLEKYFEERNQLTMDSLLGNDMSREDMINESYKLANKEIGYRIEKIK